MHLRRRSSGTGMDRTQQSLGRTKDPLVWMGMTDLTLTEHRSKSWKTARLLGNRILQKYFHVAPAGSDTARLNYELAAGFYSNRFRRNAKTLETQLVSQNSSTPRWKMSLERHTHKADVSQRMMNRQPLLLYAALNPSDNSYRPEKLVSSHLYQWKTVSPPKSI